MKGKIKQGFTLLEILVAMSIITVAGLLLIGVVVNTAGIGVQQSSKVSLGVDANDILMKIRENLKEATAIVSAYPEGSSPLYTSSPTQLVLKLSSIDSSGEIISNTYDYFVYSKDQSKLLFKTFPDPASSRVAKDQLLTSKLEDIIFEYFNNANPLQLVSPNLASKIKVTVVLKQQTGSQKESSVATSEAQLRND